MKALKSFLLIFTIIFLNWLDVQGQKVVSTSGEWTSRMETNITKEQCKEQAHELAIINAIEKAFGTWTDGYCN